MFCPIINSDPFRKHLFRATHGSIYQLNDSSLFENFSRFKLVFESLKGSFESSFNIMINTLDKSLAYKIFF